MADTTAISPHTSRCRAMFWWTRCVGYERICGGGRRRSEPEERVCSDCAPSTAALAGKAAVEGTTRSAEASPGQVGSGAGAGRAKPKTPAVVSEVPATETE